MREWTLDERYRILQNENEIRDLHERIKKSVYRQTYHVQPVTGLSNDPNGFVYHDGWWHLFYQWCPWGAVHGLKYWYHVISKDLVHWNNVGIGLKPDSFYDNKGAYSGSAICLNNELYFFYTGNHRDDDWTRTAYTCAAKLGDGGRIQKYPEPLFGPREDYSDHQRDPKIVFNKEKNKYFLFIGAQTLLKKGTVLIYESDTLLDGWSFAGQLHVKGFEDFGLMWECPDIVNISGKDVLIFSPQGLKLPGRGANTNHNVYLIGTMDYDTLTFIPDTGYQHLDHGFDFYAAQEAYQTEDPDRAILIAWMGLPDNHYPTEQEDWEGSLTLPRELRIRDGKLIQTPIAAISELRNQKIESGTVLPDTCELLLTLDGSDMDLKLLTKEDGRGGVMIHYDRNRKICTIDRSGMELRFNETLGEVLDMPLSNPLTSLRIFIDKSSLEIFANDGEAAFTSHIYPTASEHYYTKSKNAVLEIWSLMASVRDDFVVE